MEADKARRIVLPVLELNEALFKAMKEKPPVSPGGRKGGRVYYALQEGVKPPQINVYVNTKSAFTENYQCVPCLPPPALSPLCPPSVQAVH
jgi:predicted GTPase